MKKIIFLLLIIVIAASCGNDNNRKPVEQSKKDSIIFSCGGTPLPPESIAAKKRPRRSVTTGDTVTVTNQNGSTTTTVTKPKNVLFYSFNGGVISGTSWNAGGDINYLPSGLNQAQIDSVMGRAFQAFDSLNIIVTTDESVYKATPSTNRQLVAFTPTHEWYGNGASGTSFVGSFGTGDVAFVFTDALKYKALYIKEVALHESGHTLSLYHQANYDTNCNYINDYRSGVIMGYIFSTPLTNWWAIGSNPYGCNNIQKDMQQMASVVGWKY